MDEIFQAHARQQFERQLLFSTIVETTCLVVCRVTPTINSRFRMLRESITASVKSVYNKINGVEPEVSRALVRSTAERMPQILAELLARWKSPIPGFPVRILDGNHHPAS